MKIGGQLGNKNGAKKHEWSDAIRKAAFEQVDVDGKKVKRIRILARALLKAAESGDIPALKEVGDRLEGKPAQAIELATTVRISEVKRVIVEFSPLNQPALTQDKPALEHKE